MFWVGVEKERDNPWRDELKERVAGLIGRYKMTVISVLVLILLKEQTSCLLSKHITRFTP